MRFEALATVPFPLPVVFAVYRDRLVELVPYLPNIRSIELRSRTESDGVVSIVNVWQGGGEIPAIARSFVPGGATAWTDFARWDATAFTCTWRTEPHAFREAVTSEGVNTFIATGDTLTTVRISGAVNVDPARIRGVPKLLAGAVRPAVEHFIVNAVRSNLTAFAEGVTRYLGEGRT